MRDFEIVSDSKSNEQLVLARGQGIGVIISAPHQTYIKLYKKDNEIELDCGLWNLTPAAKKLLNADLGLGYDVLYIKDEDWTIERFCEELDERDKKSTAIFAPGLDKKLAKYEEPKKRKSNPKDIQKDSKVTKQEQ